MGVGGGQCEAEAGVWDGVADGASSRRVTTGTTNSYMKNHSNINMPIPKSGQGTSRLIYANIAP